MNDKLEKEVMKELDDKTCPLDKNENPFRAHRVESPYRVEMTLPQDDNNTKITRDTRSEEVSFSRSKEDVLFETELSHKHSKTSYAKHITKFVEENLWENSPKEMIVTYTGKPFIQEMANEELLNPPPREKTPEQIHESSFKPFCGLAIKKISTIPKRKRIAEKSKHLAERMRLAGRFRNSESVTPLLLYFFTSLLLYL